MSYYILMRTMHSKEVNMAENNTNKKDTKRTLKKTGVYYQNYEEAAPDQQLHHICD